MIWWDACVHFLHLLGAIAWVGGMLFTSGVVGPVLRQRLGPAERLGLIEDVGRRFRVVEGMAWTLLLGSGLWKIASVWSTRDWTNAFWRLWLVKMGLVVIVVVLALLHGFVWGPALTRSRAGGSDLDSERLTRKVIFWARVEIAGAVAVVFLGALLRMNPF